MQLRHSLIKSSREIEMTAWYPTHNSTFDRTDIMTRPGKLEKTQIKFEPVTCSRGNFFFLAFLLRSVLREAEDGDRFSGKPMLNFIMQNSRCFTKPANGLRRQELETQSPANRKLFDCGGSFRRLGRREVR